jgi:hypothetical protein
MERYFLLMIVGMFTGFTIHHEKRTEIKSGVSKRNIIATLTKCKNTAQYADFTIYSKFETSASAVSIEDIYEVPGKNVQKIIKNWPRRANKMAGSTNPRILFNVLRSLPVGEPYFIQ